MLLRKTTASAALLVAVMMSTPLTLPTAAFAHDYGWDRGWGGGNDQGWRNRDRSSFDRRARDNRDYEGRYGSADSESRYGTGDRRSQYWSDWYNRDEYDRGYRMGREDERNRSRGSADTGYQFGSRSEPSSPGLAVLLLQRDRQQKAIAGVREAVQQARTALQQGDQQRAQDALNEADKTVQQAIQSAQTWQHVEDYLAEASSALQRDDVHGTRQALQDARGVLKGELGRQLMSTDATGAGGSRSNATSPPSATGAATNSGSSKPGDTGPSTIGGSTTPGISGANPATGSGSSPGAPRTR